MADLGEMKKVEHEAWGNLLEGARAVVAADALIDQLQPQIHAAGGPDAPLVKHMRHGDAVDACRELLAAVKAENWRPR